MYFKTYTAKGEQSKPSNLRMIIQKRCFYVTETIFQIMDTAILAAILFYQELTFRLQ